MCACLSGFLQAGAPRARLLKPSVSIAKGWTAKASERAVTGAALYGIFGLFHLQKEKILVKKPIRKLPRRLRRREGESKPTTAMLNPSPGKGKPFDPVERKLSLALDALLDVIEAYKEGHR